MVWVVAVALLVIPVTGFGPGHRPHRFPTFHRFSRPVGDLFGMGTYIAQRYPALALPALQRLHATHDNWVREEFTASHLHWGPKVPYHFKIYDQIVDDELRDGFHVLGLLDYNNTWNGQDHVWMGHQSMPLLTKDFVAFATAVVGHYRRRIFYWQIWNEPDIAQRWEPKPNASDYAYLLRHAYWAIKHANPSAKVVIAGPSGADPHAVSFVKEVARDRGPFDITAIQPYTWIPSAHLRQEVLSLRKLGRPVWLTEMGWAGQRHCSTCATPLMQAAKMATLYVIGAIAGVQRIFWYDFRDDGTLPEFSDHFGLLAYDFAAKPAYHAFVDALYLLNSARIRGVRTLDHGLMLYRLRNHGRRFFVLWDSSRVHGTVHVPWNLGRVRPVDDLGAVEGRVAGSHLSLRVEPDCVEYLLPYRLRLPVALSKPVSLRLGKASGGTRLRVTAPVR